MKIAKQPMIIKLSDASVVGQFEKSWAGQICWFTVSYGVTGKAKKKKRPRDFAQLAKNIVDEATDQLPPEPAEESEKSPKAEAGRKGGLKGSKARAKKLTAEQRREIAKKAANARWQKSSA